VSLPVNEGWNIKPRSPVCQACQGEFTDGQPFHTRLVFEADGYQRGDFCDPCWQGSTGAQPRHSAWQGVFRVPPPPPQKTVRKETAESLLRGLIARDEPASPATLYILAVMLERQRVLVEREVRPGAGSDRRIVYEHRKTGETFVIPDPQLRLRDLAPVQEEVMALLAGRTGDGGPAEPQAAPPGG
jgi:hypothetical protein